MRASTYPYFPACLHLIDTARNITVILDTVDVQFAI